MPATPATQVRAGRAAAFFARAQSAPGTAQSTFTTAHRLWQARAKVGPMARPSEPRAGMENGSGPESGSAFLLPDRPMGMARVPATPAALRTVLDSNFGSFAAGAWSLEAWVTDSRWLTLALLENVSGGTYKVVRVRDAWFHRVTIVARPGMVQLEAEYAGAEILPNAASGDGVTLPAAPAEPTDKEIFPRRKATFTRDPATANVDIRFSEIRIVLDQKLSFGYGQASGLYDVSKKGPLRATVTIESDWADETWAALTLARAGTKQRYRFRAITDDATPQTFDLNLYELIWRVDDDGHDGKTYDRFRATAEARVDGSGNFVSMTLA